MDEVNQIIEVLFVWKKGDRVLSRLRAKLSSMYRKEFELLLGMAGFTGWQVYGGFEYQTFESPDQEMVWIIEK